MATNSGPEMSRTSYGRSSRNQPNPYSHPEPKASSTNGSQKQGWLRAPLFTLLVTCGLAIVVRLFAAATRPPSWRTYLVLAGCVFLWARVAFRRSRSMVLVGLITTVIVFADLPILALLGGDSVWVSPVAFLVISGTGVACSTFARRCDHRVEGAVLLVIYSVVASLVITNLSTSDWSVGLFTSAS